MKPPRTHLEREGDLDAFVAAAKTEDLVGACRLLFVNGVDLAWTKETPGQYLVDVTVGDDHEDEFREGVQLTSARADLAMRRMAQRFVPMLVDAFSELPADEGSRRAALIDGIIRRADAAKLEQTLLPVLIGELGTLTDLLTDSLVAACTAIRKRVLAATGMSEDEYCDVLYCLQRIRALVGPVVRVAYSADGFIPEVAFAGGGISATGADGDAHELEIFRVVPRLEELKRGEDSALPLFIAAYLNQHAPLPDKQAFACARYGELNTPEYDVVVPRLESAFEVKLYSAPATQNDEKLESKAAELAKQLESYVHGAKAKRVYYVTNLTREHAQRVLQRARSIARNVPEETPIWPIAGLEELLVVLRSLVMEFEQELARQFSPSASDEAEPRPAPSTAAT